MNLNKDKPYSEALLSCGTSLFSAGCLVASCGLCCGGVGRNGLVGGLEVLLLREQEITDRCLEEKDRTTLIAKTYDEIISEQNKRIEECLNGDDGAPPEGPFDADLCTEMMTAQSTQLSSDYFLTMLPCDVDQFNAIQDAAQLALSVKEQALDEFFDHSGKREIETTGVSREMAGKIIDEAGRHQVYCWAFSDKPESDAFSDRLGMVVDYPQTTGGFGSLVVYPTAFADSCELSGTLVHEVGHIVSGAKHELLDNGKVKVDWIYELGVSVKIACEESQVQKPEKAAI